jgi:hypothetical protein
MRQAKILPSAALFIGGIGLVIAVSVISESASAQTYFQCPDGYYYDPAYGCEPLSYFYGPPTYAYPDTGFGFLYGGGWGRGFRYGGHPAGGGHPGGGGHVGGGAGHGGGGGHGRH